MRTELDLRDDEPRIAHGVSGMKSRPWSKRFRDQAAFDRWMDTDAASNVTIYEVCRP